MEDKINFLINKKIKIIEDKLRNSFKLVKKDNLEILNSLNEIKESLRKENFAEQIKKIKDSLYEELKNLEKRIKENEELIMALKKELDKKNIKKCLEKELFNIFNKKIDLNFSKQKKCLKKELDKIAFEMNLIKKSFRGEIDEIREKINT